MPVIMKDNVQYAYTTKGTVFHTLSNAEYEALTEEEKMNGDVYCIPDREPILNPDEVWAKIGTETLDIGDDLTDGVNQLNSRLANYVVRYVTWNNTPASYTNGAYYYNDYITDINKSNYTIVSVWAENTKWKMPCYVVLSDVQNANYILRLQYDKSNFPNASDLANTNVSLRIGYVRN